MRILSINYQYQSSSSYVTNGVMKNFLPFGYDAVVINPTSWDEITGTSDHNSAREIFSRWLSNIGKWLKVGKLLVVIMQPLRNGNNLTNYSWQPVGSTIHGDFKESGAGNDFIGEVVTADKGLRDYLETNQFFVKTYFSTQNELVGVNSCIDTDMLTSFSIKDLGEAEMLFIPEPRNHSLLYAFIAKKLSSETQWKVRGIEEKEKENLAITNEIQALESKRQEIERELSSLTTDVESIISGDVYLYRATSIYERVIAQQSPDPEDYYEAFENIEKAFGGEYKMQKALGIGKKYYDEVMERTNQFRHAQAAGEEPEPLSEEEIRTYSEKLKDTILKFIQLLQDNA